VSDPVRPGAKGEAAAPGVPEGPAPVETDPVADMRARQIGRAKVMALALGALAVLIYAIALVKMSGRA